MEFSEKIAQIYLKEQFRLRSSNSPFPFIKSAGAIGRLIIKSPNIVPTPSTFPFLGVPIGGGVFFAWFWNIFDSVTLWIVTWNKTEFDKESSSNFSLNSSLPLNSASGPAASASHRSSSSSKTGTTGKRLTMVAAWSYHRNVSRCCWN